MFLFYYGNIASETLHKRGVFFIATVHPIRDIQKINEIKTILKTFYTERDYFMFVFGINSGLRISDILPLKVKDVKNKNFIWVTEQKTGKRRKVDISILPSLKYEIADYCKGKKDEQYLFKSTRSREPITRIQAYRILNGAAKMAGISEGIGTHTLRKTFGYHFYKRTKNIVAVQKLLNHRSPHTTLAYIGMNDEEIKEATIQFGGL